MLPEYTAPKKRKGRRTYQEPIWKSEAYQKWREEFFEDIWIWRESERAIPF